MSETEIRTSTFLFAYRTEAHRTGTTTEHTATVLGFTCLDCTKCQLNEQLAQVKAHRPIVAKSPATASSGDRFADPTQTRLLALDCRAPKTH